MRNKFRIIIFIFSVAGLLFSYAQDNTWTLEKAIKYALDNNISVQQAKNALLISEQDILAAKGNFYPSVGANVRQSLSLGQAQLFPGTFVDRTFHSTSAGINATQTVFNGFRNTYLYKQSKLNLETSTLELARISDDIALNVINAYLNVLFNRENLETAQAQLEFSNNQLEQVKALVDAGVQPKVNLYDNEATLSRDEQSLIVAENNLTLSLLSLSQLLQVPFNDFQVEMIEIAEPSASLMYNDVSPILNYALDNRVEIDIANKNIENAELNTQIAKSGYFPTVTAGYGFNTGANFSNLTEDNSFFQQLNENIGHNFSVNVSIPIFSRFQNKTNVAKSEIQVENRKLDLAQAKLNLETNIQQAFTDAQAALKAYQAAIKVLEAQQLAFNNAEDRFAIGNMTNFELEQIRVQLVNAQSDLINSKYDFVFKTKVLDFYMGKYTFN